MDDMGKSLKEVEPITGVKCFRSCQMFDSSQVVFIFFTLFYTKSINYEPLFDFLCSSNALCTSNGDLLRDTFLPYIVKVQWFGVFQCLRYLCLADHSSSLLFCFLAAPSSQALPCQSSLAGSISNHTYWEIVIRSCIGIGITSKTLLQEKACCGS